MNPLDWPAAPFLVLYCAVTAVILLWLLYAKTRLPPDAIRHGSAGLSILHIAYLAGGASRAIDTALVGLFETGAAVFDGKRGVIQINRFASAPPEFQPFCQVRVGGSTRKVFHSEHALRGAHIRAELTERGLTPDGAALAAFRRWALLILCAPVLLGVEKIVVGSLRDRPVGILAGLIVLTLVLGGFVALAPPSRSRAGTIELERLRRENARAARAPLESETALAFALVGSTALDGRSYRAFLSRDGNANGSTSSDCSGGSDGGSSGGSGCGGCSA